VKKERNKKQTRKKTIKHLPCKAEEVNRCEKNKLSVQGRTSRVTEGKKEVVKRSGGW